MDKIYNFGAGPAKLPAEVYEEIRKELTNFQGTGISLMETSHRSSTYLKLNKHVQELVRKLLNVPQNYKILFMAGGGQGQFAAVPMNLMSSTGKADYVVTGDWSKIAAREAKKYGEVNLVLPERTSYTNIPDVKTWNLSPDASYVHICVNETIHGVEFDFAPETNGVPLVADMSSDIMTRKLDVSKYGVIYAGAQKNIGTAGCTMVIVREDLLGKSLPITPSILDWTLTDKSDSILNTPPMFAIYVMSEVFKWIERSGGIEAMNILADQKSKMIYDIIDNSRGFYVCPVEKKSRSRMNLPFRLGKLEGDEVLETEFLKGALQRNLIQLKGHRNVGGIRASLYNAVTVEETTVLANYMREFQEKHN